MDWLIVDGHEDIAMALLEAPRDFGAPAPKGQALSLFDAKRGGVGLILGTIFATEGYWEGVKPHVAGVQQMDCYDQLLSDHAGDLFRVESKGDLALCRRGGPIGLLREGDMITIDVDRRRLETDADLESRRSGYQPRKPAYASGALAKYAYLVSSASEGAVTSFPDLTNEPTSND